MILRKLLLVLLSFIVLSCIFTRNILASSDPLDSLYNQTSLPYTLASHQSLLYNNHIYVFGGAGQSDIDHDQVLMSTLDSDGNVGSWNTVSNMPAKLIWHNVVKDGNNVYILGGAKLEPTVDNPTSVDTVYKSSINVDGSMSSWITLNSLPKRLAVGGTFVFNHKLYYVGGTTKNPGQTFESKIYSADISGDGSLSSWVPLNDLPEAKQAFGVFLFGNHIYIAGGTTISNIATSNVLASSINSDGTLSPWVELDHLPINLHRPGYVQLGNYLFLFGGYNGGSFLNSIYFTQVDSDGNLGSWNLSSVSLPKTDCCFSGVASSNNLYVPGGFTGTEYISDVYRIKLTDTSLVLNVPDIKQFGQSWSSNIYDSANDWYKYDPSISRWGCALTSASMILQYYGYSNVDPGALNTWLKGQKDGYIRNGLINWLAISRYTKLNGNNTLPSLEYKRLGNTNSNLENELNNLRPAILEEPGHFIVAKGKQSSDFVINDPAYSNRNLLSSYGGGFLSLGSFMPSHTDLSYIMLVINPGVTLQLTDSLGNIINGEFYTQNPLLDDHVGGHNRSGQGLGVYVFPKPANGEYNVSVSGGNGIYELDSYLYNKDGSVKTNSNLGVTDIQPKTDFVINVSDTNKTIRKTTIDSIIADLDSFYRQGLIKNKTVYDAIRADLILNKNLIDLGKVGVAKKNLLLVINTLKAVKPNAMYPSISNILISEVRALTNN